MFIGSGLRKPTSYIKYVQYTSNAHWSRDMADLYWEQTDLIKVLKGRVVTTMKTGDS